MSYMIHRSKLALGLLLLLAAGCASPAQESAPGKMMSRFRSLWGGLGPDAIQLELALVQRPLDDPYVSRDVWREVDEQVLPLDRRPTLEANGLRVGTISGTVPSGLQKLLTGQRHTCIQGHTWEISGSENDGNAPLCPYCQLRSMSKENFVTARRKGVRPNEPFFLPLGPEKPLKLSVTEDGAVVPIECESAQAGLQIHLCLTDAGDVQVRCEPRIQHGSHLRIPQPSADKDGWSFLSGRAEHQFPKLACEICLEPNEYLVIGAWNDRRDTLGQRCFCDFEAGKQTLLVVRTARPQSDPRQQAVASKETKPSSGPLPLALQSIMPKKPPQPQLSRGQSSP
jgi:hypothetical protein